MEKDHKVVKTARISEVKVQDKKKKEKYMDKFFQTCKKTRIPMLHKTFHRPEKEGRLHSISV